MILMRWFLCVVCAVLAGSVLATSVSAQTTTSGPSVTLDQYELTPGDRVMLTMTGFRTDNVTMSFCGNDGRRGSIDCNMQASQAQEINQDGTPTLAEVAVASPPASCPCIIRVSSRDNREIAVASVTIVGHPVGDVVGGSGFDQPLAVEIAADAFQDGIGDEIRSSLGGSTLYDVTIRVTNQGSYAIDNVGVASTFTRMRYDDVRTVDMPSAGRLDAGVTWEQTVRVEVPALTFGDVEWSATASGAGPSVEATTTTSQVPLLLILVGGVLVVDLLLLLWRLIIRIRRRRNDRDPDDNPFIDDPDASIDDDTWADTQGDRAPQLVG